MSAPVSQRYSVEFDPHEYLAEMRRVLCDPSSGVVTTGWRYPRHKENELALTELARQVGKRSRGQLEALLRDLGISKPDRVVPIATTSFKRTAGTLSVVSDRYAGGQFSLAGLAPGCQRQVLEALWKEFLELGRVLPATVQLRSKFPLLYETAEDFATLVAEYEGRVDRGVITRFAVYSAKDPRKAINQFLATVETLTTKYGGLVEPGVIKHFAVNNATAPGDAIDDFLIAEETLTAKYGGKVEAGVITRVALNNPRNPGKAMDEYIRTEKRLAAKYKGRVDPSVIKYFALYNPKDPDNAIDEFLPTVKALQAEYKGRVEPGVITRCALYYPKDRRKAINATLTSAPVKQAALIAV